MVCRGIRIICIRMCLPIIAERNSPIRLSMNNLHIDLEGNMPKIKVSQMSDSVTRLGNFHICGYVLSSRLAWFTEVGPLPNICNIAWIFSLTCWKCGTRSESQDKSGLSLIHNGFWWWFLNCPKLAIRNCAQKMRWHQGAAPAWQERPQQPLPAGTEPGAPPVCSPRWHHQHLVSQRGAPVRRLRQRPADNHGRSTAAGAQSQQYSRDTAAGADGISIAKNVKIKQIQTKLSLLDLQVVNCGVNTYWHLVFFTCLYC